MATLFRTGRTSSGSDVTRRQLSSVYTGGSSSVVHAPSLANATSTSARWGSTRNSTATAASPATSHRAPPRATGRRSARTPLPSDDARGPRPSSRRRSSTAAIALTASTVVSTYAIPSSPLRREATICVLSTRSPPPNT
jgi:hypothetical protein